MERLPVRVDRSLGGASQGLARSVEAGLRVNGQKAYAACVGHGFSYALWLVRLCLVQYKGGDTAGKAADDPG